MSKRQKQIARLVSIPSDYTYSELSVLLRSFGYVELNKGKTSGSRVRFFREADNHVIDLHKPHPGDILGKNAVRAIIRTLVENGDVSI